MPFSCLQVTPAGSGRAVGKTELNEVRPGVEILRTTQELLSGLGLLVFCEVLDKITILRSIHPRVASKFKTMTIGSAFSSMEVGSLIAKDKDYVEISDYLSALQEKYFRVY